MSTSIKSGVSFNIPWKIPDGPVLAHLGFSSKASPRPLTYLSVWVGFGTSSAQQRVKYHLRLSTLFEVVFLNMSRKISDGKVLAHFGLKPKVLPRSFIDLSVWVGFCTSSTQYSVKCQLLLNKYIFGGWGADGAASL